MAKLNDDKMQLNLFVSPEIIARLESLAATYKGSSKKRTEIAAEIVELYSPHWEAAEKARLKHVESQLDKIRNSSLTAPKKIVGGNMKVKTRKLKADGEEQHKETG